jgi:hypothetical protein
MFSPVSDSSIRPEEIDKLMNSEIHLFILTWIQSLGIIIDLLVLAELA